MLNPATFALWLKERAAKKDGYILCTVGQDPKKLNQWYYDQYSGKQLEKALYWKDHAERVWDCQGMADGYVTEFGDWGKINVRARNNYADWCGIKGEGKIPAEHRMPGAAVFIYNGDYISHVGFLVEPIEAGNWAGDWYVVEARGVMYGVVTTKLNGRGWNRWGLMTKYFDYATVSDPDVESDEVILKKGMTGDAVAALQRDLIALGYSCGKYGADGEFGNCTKSALKAFQQDNGLEADGVAGSLTLETIDRLLRDGDEAPDNQEAVRLALVCYGTWYIRSAPSTSAAKLGCAKEGETYAVSGDAVDGWIGILYNGERAWVSAKGVDTN